MRRRSTCARSLATALILATALGFAAPAGAADETKASVTSVKVPLATATAVKLGTLAPGPRAFVQSTPASSTSDGQPFLKSPKGVAVIVLMVLGAGYAIYSANHDRDPVKSPIR